MIKKIAVTGGIGSGKSTVCKMLRSLGYPVFSCDIISKELQRNKNYIKEIRALFPTVVVDNAIDVKKLAKIVFANPIQRKRLDDLAHPLIMKMLHERMSVVKEGFAFAEVPLLFEGKFQNQFDGVIVVVRSRDKRIQSIVQRDGINEAQAIARMKSQFDYDAPNSVFFIQDNNAFVLENNGTEEELFQELKKIIVKQLT